MFSRECSIDDKCQKRCFQGEKEIEFHSTFISFRFSAGQCVREGRQSRCQCSKGWTGEHCDQRLNPCRHIQCENRGVCFPVGDQAICKCLGNNYYSGDRCQHRQKSLIIFQIISKSSATLSIIIISSFVLFIFMMDCLKYCVGIDPTREDLEEIQAEKKKKKKKQRPIVEKFIYVNP